MGGMIIGGESIFMLAAFFAAILLVDSYDIALPRGDSIAMAGAIVAAVIVVFGPSVGLVLGFASTMLIQMVRRVRQRDAALVDELVIRVAAICVAMLVDAALQGPGLTYAQPVLVPGSFLIAELFGRQVVLAARGKRALRGLVLGNVARQWLLFAAQLSVAALTVLTFESMGIWTIVPVAALLLLMRQAYAVLLEIRETYLTTVSVLVEAAESQSPGLSGHSERTAAVARSIASRCGLAPGEVERLSYAALLHDVNRISESGDDPVGSSCSSLVSGIAFFEQVVPVLDVMQGASDPGIDEKSLLAGFIVALSSDIEFLLSQSGSTPRDSSVSRIAERVPPRMKADVVSAAVGLGYPVPAID